MHRLLLAALLLTATPASALQMTWSTVNEMVSACDLLDVACDIPRPMLIITELPDGIMGLHPTDTNVVLVSSQCNSHVADFTKCTGILVHEIVHYILNVKFPDITSCESERRAWDVYNKYVVREGRPDLQRLDWIKSYPQCAKSLPSSTLSDTQ